MRHSMTGGILLALCFGWAGGLVSEASAAPRRDRGTGVVTACSRYGNGCVSGPTRQGRIEREVRMPGGTWIACKLDCRETLREETVDFWDTIRERAPGGMFR